MAIFSSLTFEELGEAEPLTSAVLHGLDDQLNRKPQGRVVYAPTTGASDVPQGETR